MDNTPTTVLAGLGSWLPTRRVTNEELCRDLDSTPDWIRTRSGIQERRWIEPGTGTLELAVEAGRRALESAERSDVSAGGSVSESVDTVVVVTTSPDRTCPGVAPEVASRLGLSGASAMDLAAACSGFVYGMAVSSGLIASRTSRGVLLIGAEAFTPFVDPADRSTAPLFGDGAGAVVLRPGSSGEPGALGPFDLGSDGSGADLLAVPAGGSRQRASSRDEPTAAEKRDWYLTMDGRAIYQQAVRRMSASAGDALAKAGWTTQDVDCVIAHQANTRILISMAGELGIPMARVPSNIQRVGNTLTASIPLVMNDAVSSGELKPGDRVLITAFGAGLAWGSLTLVWPDLVVTAVQ
jgi:3-oxoacyl-[acyl-carrier-protein] synthase-3